MLLLTAMPFSGCACPTPVPDAGPSPDVEPETDGGGCSAGEESCACLPGNTCSGTLTCDEGICVQAATSGLTFPDGAVGCEFIAREVPTRILGATFGTTTTGTFVRESPRVAIALVKAAGQTGPLDVAIAGTDFTIESVKCVDAAGAAVQGSVQLNP